MTCSRPTSPRSCDDDRIVDPAPPFFQGRGSECNTRRVSRFEQLESCSDISIDDADRDVRSLDDLRAFLSRCAEIARNGEGCARLLGVVARLARGDVSWIEGDVRAELVAEGDERTTLALYTELGFGLRERLVPATSLPVAFEEIARAVALAPALVTPLQARVEATRLVLAREASEPSAAPPAFEVAAARASDAPTTPPEGSVVSRAPEGTVHSRPTIRASLVDLEELLARDAKTRSGRP